MNWRRQTSFLLAISISLAGLSCGRRHAYEQMGSDALIQVVRSYNPHNQAGQAPTVAPALKLQTEEEYAAPVKENFSKGNFDQLEKIVREARESKGRVVGGTWKVLAFYFAIDGTFLSSKPKESEWKMLFDSLNQWVKTKPESAAARISLAQAYMDYAWEARGGGYASTVSRTGWELFGERTAQAAATLVEAAHLKEKCPYWYETMQTVALAQGWDKAQATELLEQAVAFEPDYYHFYREHANFLQTKWYGKEGEVEAYAAEVADRIGSSKGDIVYFEITSLLGCQCDAEANAMQNMSWQRIKRGYEALEQEYGVSELKRNRFASMAVKAGDKPAARDTIAQIGAQWDKSVWVSSDRFESAKNWAMTE